MLATEYGLFTFLGTTQLDTGAQHFSILTATYQIIIFDLDTFVTGGSKQTGSKVPHIVVAQYKVLINDVSVFAVKLQASIFRLFIFVAAYTSSC